jgi:predicted Rossmann-fold nucleotide-binding protein
MRAAALIVFPGELGTFDELFEILTLRQTSKAPDIPIALVDKGYWTSVVNFQKLVEHGMISERDLSLFSYVETPDEIWNAISASGLKVHVKWRRNGAVQF